MKNTISVIIPAMNDETYLVRCLNNLKRQTEKPLEIIIAEENVVINTIVEENVFCLAKEDKLSLPKIDVNYKPQKKDVSNFIFDEERRIASNVNKAISLARGEYIVFINVTSTLNLKLLELIGNNDNTKLNSATHYYFDGETYQAYDKTEIIWGKSFYKEFLKNSKLSKWNYLEILRWIDEVQSQYKDINSVDGADIYDESYNNLIQRDFTVKLKDDINKYKKFFVQRAKGGRELFENINTYDYVKINIITAVITEVIDNSNLVIEITDKYALPIYENRLNAKKNRVELLKTAFCNFFKSIEENELQYEAVLMLFGMTPKTCEMFKLYNFEMFDIIQKRWNEYKH